MTNHMTEERLSAYLDGELNSVEQAEVERALQENPGLRQLYEELSKMRQYLQAMPRLEPSTDLRNRVVRSIERRSLLSTTPAASPKSTTTFATNRRLMAWVAGGLATAAAVLLIFYAASPGRLFDSQPLASSRETSEDASDVIADQATEEQLESMDRAPLEISPESSGASDDEKNRNAESAPQMAARSKSAPATAGNKSFEVLDANSSSPSKRKLEAAFGKTLKKGDVDQILAQFEEQHRVELVCMVSPAELQQLTSTLSKDADHQRLRRDQSFFQSNKLDLRANTVESPGEKEIEQAKGQSELRQELTKSAPFADSLSDLPTLVLRGSAKEVRSTLETILKTSSLQYQLAAVPSDKKSVSPDPNSRSASAGFGGGAKLGSAPAGKLNKAVRGGATKPDTLHEKFAGASKPAPKETAAKAEDKNSKAERQRPLPTASKATGKQAQVRFVLVLERPMAETSTEKVRKEK